MSQELKEIGVKRCYACIQWDGQRTFYPEKKQIKVDAGGMGTCLLTHTKIKGFRPLRPVFPLR